MYEGLPVKGSAVVDTWPVLILATIPVGIGLAVAGYLIARFPRPYVLPIPALVGGLFVFARIAGRRTWGQSRRFGSAVFCILSGYLVVAIVWAALGLIAAAVVLAVSVLASGVLIWKGGLPAAEPIWGRPRDPEDTRTTSPF